MCSLGWPRGEGRKPHTHRGLLPPSSGPVPEVKPIQPNLLAWAGKLHRFGDRVSQHGKPARPALQNVTSTWVQAGQKHRGLIYQLSLVSNCRTFPGWQHHISSGMTSKCSKCSQFQFSCYHLQTSLLHWNSLHSVLIRYVLICITAVSSTPHFRGAQKATRQKEYCLHNFAWRRNGSNFNTIARHCTSWVHRNTSKLPTEPCPQTSGTKQTNKPDLSIEWKGDPHRNTSINFTEASSEVIWSPKQTLLADCLWGHHWANSKTGSLITVGESLYRALCGTQGSQPMHRTFTTGTELLQTYSIFSTKLHRNNRSLITKVEKYNYGSSILHWEQLRWEPS